ncbi:MAG: hypothetical protein AAFV53_30725 [Myxococcota bacterium]
MVWPLSRSLLCAVALFVAVPALAQDDDDDWLLEDEEDLPEKGEDDEEKERGEDESWMDDFEEEGDERPDFDDESDFFEEDDEVRPRGEGEDTATIYRQFAEEVRALPADEEALAWDRYMREYPNTIFRDSIEERLTTLEREMFSQDLDGPDSIAGQRDAARQELYFAQPVGLENIDPITKLRVGGEIGLPNYVNGIVDYERQLLRELSAHIGIRNRLTPGFSLEVGARYAIVKSARTRTLVTAIGDFRLGLSPAFPAIRPQLAVGQRFDVGDGFLDVQVQGGSDMTFIPDNEGNALFEPRVVGGVNLSLTPNDQIRVFLEGSTYMKDFGFESGPFRYNVMTFGLKILRFNERTGTLKAEYAAAANAPIAPNYWSQHQR